VPTISQTRLRDDIVEILRRAEAGERFTITVAGRPVAELGPAVGRQWVTASTLDDLFALPADAALAGDISAFDGELRDPDDEDRA
jgi:prevent-host-death family protein